MTKLKPPTLSAVISAASRALPQQYTAIYINYKNRTEKKERKKYENTKIKLK